VFDTVGRIFELRDNRKMKTSQFAEFTGVSQPYMSQLERGEKKNVTIDIIEKICTACEITLSDFFNNSDNPANIKASTLSREKDDLISRVEKLKIEIDNLEKRIK
jgi:transcriptional regulator with XRE-family HTH domain